MRGLRLERAPCEVIGRKNSVTGLDAKRGVLLILEVNMYISVPVIIILGWIVLALWAKGKRNHKALRDVNSALYIVSKATNLMPRLKSLNEIYKEIDDVSNKVNLQMAYDTIKHFLDDDEGVFDTAYGTGRILYNFEYGDNFESLSHLIYMANSSTETIEERLKLIKLDGYEFKKITVKWKS